MKIRYSLEQSTKRKVRMQAPQGVGTTPKCTHGGLAKHSSFGLVAHPTLCLDVHMEWHVARPTLYPDDHGTGLRYTPPLAGCPVRTQWLASQTRVLIAFRGQSSLILPKACSTGPSWVTSGDLPWPTLCRLQSKKTRMIANHPSSNLRQPPAG